ncbi:MAG TPA: hypothetical protein VFC07_13470 [Verrucomicrobiae bacterium]|nr:hypothetical protein [Verrucomicrobiae bacterium]
MRPYKVIGLVGVVLFAAGILRAQTTNFFLPLPPPTALERAEIITNEIIIKGTSQAGAMVVSDTTVSLVCEEVDVPGANEKHLGLRVEFSVEGQTEDRVVVDYDELNGLLGAIDYLAKVDWTATPLASFDASFTTKGGLRVAAFSSKRAEAIVYSVRSSRMNKGVALGLGQLTQLRQLLGQAKRSLDELQSK